MTGGQRRDQTVPPAADGDVISVLAGIDEFEHATGTAGADPAPAPPADGPTVPERADPAV